MGAKGALKERGSLSRTGGGEQSLCTRSAGLPSGPWLTPHPGEAQPFASAPIGCRACRGNKARSSGSGRLQLPYLLLLPCLRSEMGTRLLLLLLLLGLSLLLGLLQGEPLPGIWEDRGDWV